MDFRLPRLWAFGLELYEAGILTDQDMAGMPSDNEGRFYWLLEPHCPTGRDRGCVSQRDVLGGPTDRQGRRRLCS